MDGALLLMSTLYDEGEWRHGARGSVRFKRVDESCRFV